MLLTSNGTPLTYGVTGFVDSFAYTDGPLTVRNSLWVDAYDTWPNSYDRATVTNGVLNTTAYHQNTFPTLVAHPSLVGHTLAVIDLADVAGMTGHTTDNFQVSVTWDTTDPFAIASQISPCAFVDIAAASYVEMGVKPVWDVSVISTYMQNVFRSTTIGDVFDYQTIAEGDTDDEDYYNLLSTTATYLWSAGPSNPTQCMMLRVRSGQCRGYWNGVPITPIVTVPAWAVGRSYVGIDVIHTHAEIGQTVGSLGVVDHAVEDLITAFSAVPFTGTL